MHHHAARQTRTYLMSLFERRGLNPRSDLGQNFLIDLNVIDFIVKSAELDERDVVLEVGAGTGSMTSRLARAAGAVVTVEYDSNMAEMAREIVSDVPNVTLLECDALKNKNRIRDEVLDAVRAELAKDPTRRLKLVANLPYSIATPIVSNLVASDLPWDRMVVTIQMELGQRMAAGPGKSNYGALSAWLQSQAFVKILRRLGPQVFWPRPAVVSAVVLLTPAPAKAALIADRAFLQEFLRLLFTQRRKVMRPVLVGQFRNRLPKATVETILTDLGHGPKTRAECLEPYQLVELANRLHAAIAASGGRQPAEASVEDSGIEETSGEEEYGLSASPPPSS